MVTRKTKIEWSAYVSLIKKEGPKNLKNFHRVIWVEIEQDMETIIVMLLWEVRSRVLPLKPNARNLVKVSP